MQILDGRKLNQEILDKVKIGVKSLSFQPIFCDVLVGSDPSSAQYVRMKAKKAESVGIKFHNANFPESITTEELIKEIKALNSIKSGLHVCPAIASPKQREELNAGLQLGTYR
ncbi:TPA: hypothetical protein DGD59_00295 [Candidatus Collierbacteria bacterium]|nr:hypothetical protein [Candidatus Collierbacteria bacterium]